MSNLKLPEFFWYDYENIISYLAVVLSFFYICQVVNSTQYLALISPVTYMVLP